MYTLRFNAPQIPVLLGLGSVLAFPYPEGADTMLSRLMTRREQIVIVLLASALLLGSVTIFIMREPANPSVQTEIEIPTGALARSPEIPTSVQDGTRSIPEQKSRNEVVVSLVGSVSRPAVYTLEAGSRIQDLLLAAGGPTDSADTSDINLAAKLIDGTTLIVSARASQADQSHDPVAVGPRNIPEYTISAWQTHSTSHSSSGGAFDGLININQATQSQLESLPGIGPKYAQEIIRYRTSSPFNDTKELLKVSGIGPKRYEAMRDLVTIQ